MSNARCVKSVNNIYLFIFLVFFLLFIWIDFARIHDLLEMMKIILFSSTVIVIINSMEIASG